MKRPVAYHHASHLDLPMTPMIDVVFQLIIFFLCTTRFTPLEHVLPMHLDLPGAQGAVTKVSPDLQDLTEIVIILEAHQDTVGISVNRRPVASMAELRSTLMTLGKIRLDVPIVIDPSPEVRISRVIEVYDLCREIGFVNIQFATPADR
ncbi:MAG TPA: biopolymer transporter ExbD [Thermogutta sp.]|nr:biopolymer transporter ExbD [Thermogutta sp.]